MAEIKECPDPSMRERVMRLETHHESVVDMLADLKEALQRHMKIEEANDRQFLEKFDRMDKEIQTSFNERDKSSNERHADVCDKINALDNKLTRNIAWATGAFSAIVFIAEWAFRVVGMH